jgi:hypothetical protein
LFSHVASGKVLEQLPKVQPGAPTPVLSNSAEAPLLLCATAEDFFPYLSIGHTLPQKPHASFLIRFWKKVLVEP